MKTERVTLLTTAEFKTFLAAEARREGVSVAELVRNRCEQRPSDDETALAALAAELRRSVTAARKSLREGLEEAHAVLSELAATRTGHAAPGPDGQPARRARKTARTSA